MHGRVEGVALRQGRRRLHQLPARPRRVLRLRRRGARRREKVPTRDFERCIYFEGCMPIEEMARRGPRHARLRPDAAGRARSIRAPARAPYAVRAAAAGRRRGPALQHGRLPDEDDVPGAAPRLPHDPGARAAPSSCASAACTATPSSTRRRCCCRRCSSTARKRLLLAGQIVGVEGYVESAATGLLAGLNAARLVARRAAASCRRAPPRSARCSPTSRSAAARTSSR